MKRERKDFLSLVLKVSSAFFFFFLLYNWFCRLKLACALPTQNIYRRRSLLDSAILLD